MVKKLAEPIYDDECITCDLLLFISFYWFCIHKNHFPYIICQKFIVVFTYCVIQKIVFCKVK